MNLTDEEVKTLDEWFLRVGWIDRDWEFAEAIQKIRTKVRDEITKINYNKVFNSSKK